MEYIYFALLCVAASGIIGTAGLRCHQCSGVTDPHYCSMIVQCAADEECHTEKVIGDGSAVFYNAGCQKKQLCQLAAKGRRSELHVCEGCCGNDLCNTELCPAHNSSSPGVQCYQCDEVDSPLDCNNRVTCANGEQCIVEKYANDKLEEKFSLGCETKPRCTLLNQISRRSTQLCNECCDTPGCNRHLCFKDNSTSSNTTTTAATNSSCVDEPNVDCKLANDTQDICAKRTLAATQFCQKFCGYCSEQPLKSNNPQEARNLLVVKRLLFNGANGATVQPPPTGTTQDPCRDSGVIDCKQLNDSLHLCAKKNTPPVLMYCPKFCKVCTPSTSPCVDSPDVDCKKANDTQGICAKRTLAATNYCPNFCGYCVPDGSTRTTVPPPTGTTEDPCKDSGDIDCKHMNDTLQICLQKTAPPTMLYCPKFCKLCTPACADSPDVDCVLANKTQGICDKRTLAATNYCPKFCGYCNADGSTNPTPPPASGTTQDPCRDTGDIDCKQMDDSLHICAQKTSPPTMLYCSKYCGLC